MRFSLPTIILPAILTVALGTAAAMVWSRPHVEANLALRLDTVAQSLDIHDLKIAMSGRDATVTGLTTNPVILKKFVRSAQQTPGVRTVSNQVDVAPAADPFPFVIRREGRALFLSGGVPDVETREWLAQRTGADVRGLMPLSGYPPRKLWLKAIDEGMALSQQLAEGEVRLENLAIAVDGIARSQSAYQKLMASNGQAFAPWSGQVQIGVQPPVQRPYFWNASFDGAKVIMSGFAPSTEALNTIKAALPAEIPIRATVRSASGAPADFVHKARSLVSAFPMVEGGDAHILDERLRFNGTPSTPENARILSEKLAELHANWMLMPPRISPFWLAGTKENGTLRLSGYAPAAATRKKLYAVGDTDVDAVRVARGAPEGFGTRIDLALASMAHLDEGAFRLQDNELKVSGRAANANSFKQLQQMAESARQAGTRVKLAQLEPALADPYTFLASKQVSGDIVLEGHVPSADVKTALRELAGQKALDATELASGAPKDFLSKAQRGLGLLKFLAEGAVSFDGTTWALTGTAIDHAAGVAAQKEAAGANLAAVGWKIDVTVPKAVVANPYRWHAQKNADGSFVLSGYTPTPGLQKFLEVHVNTKVDGAKLKDLTEIAGGEPGNFIENALRTLNALAVLQSGEGGFDGQHWLLKGSAKSKRGQTMVQAVLDLNEAATKDWVVEVSAPEPATPETSPTGTPVTGTPVTETPPTAIPDTAKAGSAAPTAPQPTIGAEGAPSSGEAPKAAAAVTPTPEGQTPDSQTPESQRESAPAEESPSAPNNKLVNQEPGSAASDTAAAPDTSASTPDTLRAAPDTSAAVAPDYAFKASKKEGEKITLSGDVPTEAAKSFFGVIAGEVPIEGLAVVTPAPAKFIETATVALRALNEMRTGQVIYKGGVWTISGEALTAQLSARLSETLNQLPNAGQMRLEITSAPPIALCREKIDAFDQRNAILFRPGSDSLTPDSQREVDELATLLQLCPKAKVQVEGHTDSDGDPASNLVLSVGRAEAVVDALIARGVQQSRLYAIGYGESLPVASNDTAAGKRANRRIVVKLSEKGL